MVNGQLYTVPDLVVQDVKSGTNTHPVLAWRSAGCVYLLGSSRLMVSPVCYLGVEGFQG